MSADVLREQIIEELRKTAQEGRVYRTTNPWPIGPLGNRGDPNLIGSLPLAEALANALQVSFNVIFLSSAISIYDNTNGVPSNPTLGDSYIAQETANGWIKDYFYSWNGTIWTEIVPAEGVFIVWLESTSKHIFYRSGEWVNFDGSSTIQNPLLIGNNSRLKEYIVNDKPELWVEMTLDGGQTWVKKARWYFS